MLGNTQEVQDYFKQSSIQIKPLVSAEWNYNLLYKPYVTFTGSGTNLYAPNGDWVSNGNPKMSITNNTDGKITSAFTDPSAKRFTVNASDVSSTLSFEAGAHILLSTLPAGSNCYKVVFYAKSIDNNLINLSTQAYNNVAKVYGSTFNTIDNFNWQKIEMLVGANNTASYTDFRLDIDFVNTTLNATGPWGIEICHMEIYQITKFDYTYNQMWDTNSIFSYFRPGESYITSGNTNIPSVIRTTSKITGSWNNVMPCSPVVYSPRTLFSANSNPIYKNGSLSAFSKYKYFVSEMPIDLNGHQLSTSIGASYEEALDVNKIVIKFNLSQSVPSGTLSLYSPSSKAAIKTIVVKSTDISAAGVYIVYYNGTDWTTNKWAWTENNKTNMPTIGNDGKITISQKINKLVFTQASSEVVKTYDSLSYNKSVKSDVLKEFKRLQVIEISPRLELDLSSFVLDYEVVKDLDSKTTPLPLSSMSANTANISLSNIPLSGTGNVPLSVFSTNSNNSTVFVSPLKNLLVKNVKFYVNYYIPSERLSSQTLANRIIPGGTFYTDTWDNQDIKVTKVTCYDSIKFLQTLPVNDYVSSSQSLINIFTNIMDFAGFTDYNYDELVEVLKDNNQNLNTSYFFADSKAKTVYDVLREAFLAFQVGSSIDENGVLRFTNLQQVMSNNGESYVIDDKSIVVNSYNENIKTKIGKLVMRYRMPQIKNSVDVGSNTQNINTVLTKAPSGIWQEESEDLVPFNYLSKSILTNSQNYYDINRDDFNSLFYSTTFEHSGYAFIEGEIITTGEKEWLLTATETGETKHISVANLNDLTIESAQFAADKKTGNIQKTPTGRFLNVERGLFGTPSNSHIVMQNNGIDFNTKFQYASIATGQSYINKGANCPISTTTNSAIVPTNSSVKSIVYPKYDSDMSYNTYSVKFKLPNISSSVSAGLFFNLNRGYNQTISSNYYTVGITATSEKNSTKKYNLDIFNVSISGIKTSVYSKDITNYIIADFANQPKISSFLARQGNFINLRFVVDGSNIIVYVNNHKIISSQTNNLFATIGSSFGFFSETSSTAQTQVSLAEIYACTSKLEDFPRYHFLTQRYLDGLVLGNNIKENFSLIQVTPEIIGLNIYDVQTQINPSIGAEPLKIAYALYYQQIQGQQNSTKWVVVEDEALSYSTILNSGFRLKFAVANNSPYAVWTKTTGDYTNAIQSQFVIMSRDPILLTDQQTLERVLNPQNVNEVIELQSDWIQSKKSASSILGVVAKASDSFSKDITVELFGNPLIQVGDVIALSHDLKNIKDLLFFVQSVRNTFNQGLSTHLVLNQLGYDGLQSTKSPASKYPSSNNVLTNSNILTVTPQVGNSAGSTSITIAQGIGFDQADPPVVFFDSFEATDVVVVNSTTLTAKTPSHTAGFVPVRVVSKGITYMTQSYNAFEYQGNNIVLNDISPTVVSDVLNAATGKHDIAIDWVPQSVNENWFAWSVSNGTSGEINEDDTTLYKLLVPNLLATQTYTITITPEYKLNGVLMGKGQPQIVTVTAGNGFNPDPNAAPIFTLTGTKTASNVATIKATVTSGFADKYTFQWFDGISSTPKRIQSSIPYNVDSYSGAQTGWYIYVTAFNGTQSSSEVILYSSIQQGASLDPSPGGTPSQPNIITAAGTSNNNGTSNINIYVAQDTSANQPTSYVVEVTPGITQTAPQKFVFDLSTISPSNNQYALLVQNAIDGVSYLMSVTPAIGLTIGTANQITVYINSGGHTISDPTLSSDVTLSWTGDSFFLGYDVYWQSELGVVGKYTVSKSGTNWIRKKDDGSNIIVSSNGINFVDAGYEGTNKFTPGDVVNVLITPLKSGIAGDAKKSNNYTIPTPAVGVTPTGPKPSVYMINHWRNIPSGTVQTHTGGSWYWEDKGLVPSAPLGAQWRWRWNVYYNKTTASGSPNNTGTLIVPQITGTTPNQFIVQTGTVGTHYLEVYMEILYNGTWYASPNKGGQKGVFT